MADVTFVKLFDPTGSTSYYDVWCDRALIVTRTQCFLAGSYAAALMADTSVPNTNGYSHRSIPDWEKGISVVPICLAAINCPPKWLTSLWLCGFHHDEIQKTLVFATSQTFQFLLCTLLTVHDFIRHGNAPLFWLSLVLWWLPAFIACAHGTFGLHAIYLQYFPHIEINLSEPQLHYSDVEDDEGPLAQAFHLQQETNRHPHEEILEPALIASLDADGLDMGHPRETYWQDSATLDTSNSTARFRWQDRLRSKAWILWFPYAFANSLSMLSGQAMGFTLRHTTYEGSWSEFKRIIMVITLVPVGFTVAANLAILWAVLRSKFTLIFVAFCLHVFAAITWITALMAALTTYSTYRPFAMWYYAPCIVTCHCILAYVALKLEWDPNYNSLMQIIKRRR